MMTEDDHTGRTTRYNYDEFDNLIKADYEQTGKQEVETIYRVPDRIDNLFETKDRTDRKYGKGSRLTEDPVYYYHYDDEGYLIFKEFKKQQQGTGFYVWNKKLLKEKYGIEAKASMSGWLYEWDSSGMLTKVTNPQQGKVSFGYDALGRRVYKEVKNKRTCWVWDGNVPLHEWTELQEEPKIDIITWVFEEGSFVPCARFTENSKASIVTDYLGTPTQMYDDEGKKTWSAELDIYGRVRTFDGRSLKDCPFRYQGQYEDVETGLYYNRFRYYDPNMGSYLSQDPIGLAGGNPTIYGYVKDTNSWIDVFGLECDIAKTRKLAEKVPSKFKEIYKCKQFAKNLKSKMKKEGIQGEHIEVKSEFQIYSDKAGKAITEDGTHQAIRVGDTIFDNMNPSGIKYDDWANDIALNDSFHGQYMKEGNLDW